MRKMPSAGRLSLLPACSSNSLQLADLPLHLEQPHEIIPWAFMTPAAEKGKRDAEVI